MGYDWVRGWELILVISPDFVAWCECDPVVCVFGTFCCCKRGDKLGKGFVEPQIPTTSWSLDFRTTYVRARGGRSQRAFHAGRRWPYRENIAFCKCHTTYIFHCACIVFRHKYLIVFFKWIRVVKIFFVIGKALFCYIYYIFGVHVFCQDLRQKLRVGFRVLMYLCTNRARRNRVPRR